MCPEFKTKISWHPLTSQLQPIALQINKTIKTAISTQIEIGSNHWRVRRTSFFCVWKKSYGTTFSGNSKFICLWLKSNGMPSAKRNLL